MLGEPRNTQNWSEIMLRMVHEFEDLVESQPACLADIVQELLKHDESITFLNALGDKLAGVKEAGAQALSTEMHRHGYYASAQGPWLVCSKNKRQHDTMLFAAQAAQVLAKANMTLVPLLNRRKESDLAA